MLNKRLLIASAKKKEQRKVKLTIGYLDGKYGYSKIYSFGSLDVVPYWGTTNDVMKRLAYTRMGTEFSAPSGITAFAEGYTQGITSGKTIKGDIYSMGNSEGAIRYLTFDPPRRLLGSKDTQTDLEYYVEEIPWEVQNAEQRPSNDDEEWSSRSSSGNTSIRFRRRKCSNTHGMRSDVRCALRNWSYRALQRHRSKQTDRMLYHCGLENSDKYKHEHNSAFFRRRGEYASTIQSDDYRHKYRQPACYINTLISVGALYA